MRESGLVRGVFDAAIGEAREKEGKGNAYGCLGVRRARLRELLAMGSQHSGSPVPVVARVRGHLSTQTSANTGECVTGTHRRSVAGTPVPFLFLPRATPSPLAPWYIRAHPSPHATRPGWCNRHTRSGRKRGRERLRAPIYLDPILSPESGAK